MGCDIHAAIEYKPPHTGFATFAIVHLARDYGLFRAIAFGEDGVADNLPIPPRGLPEDLGAFTLADELRDSWPKLGPDFHTPGWLDRAEILDLLRHAGLTPESCQHDFRAVLHTMGFFGEIYGTENVRLVFCFDG